MPRVLPLVGHVPVAHFRQRRLRLLRKAQIPLHLGPDIEPLRVRNIQIDVIAARIHRRQNRKQSFAGIQADGSLVRILRLVRGLASALFGVRSSRFLLLIRGRCLSLRLSVILGLVCSWLILTLVLSPALRLGRGLALTRARCVGLTQAQNRRKPYKGHNQEYSTCNSQETTQESLPQDGP